MTFDWINVVEAFIFGVATGTVGIWLWLRADMKRFQRNHELQREIYKNKIWGGGSDK